MASASVPRLETLATDSATTGNPRCFSSADKNGGIPLAQGMSKVPDWEKIDMIKPKLNDFNYPKLTGAGS